LIERVVEYRANPGKIKLKLAALFIAKGIDISSAFECAHDCVTAGEVTAFWRDRMEQHDAAALDSDLKGMRIQ
jgi:hypothetical protein